MGAPGVATDGGEVFFNQHKHLRPLLNCATLKEFLAEVVAVAVNHDVLQRGAHFLKHELNESGVSARKFLLQVARAALRAGEARDVAGEQLLLLGLRLVLFKLLNQRTRKNSAILFVVLMRRLAAAMVRVHRGARPVGASGHFGFVEERLLLLYFWFGCELLLFDGTLGLLFYELQVA